jgi:protein phosphatase
LPVAIIFNLPERIAFERHEQRTDRSFGPHVIHTQSQQLRRGLGGLKKEGFKQIFEFRLPEEVEAAVIERQKLWTDKRDEHGPFDIIGDIHGCFDELHELLSKLDYKIEETNGCYSVTPPENRKAVFLWIVDQRRRKFCGL